MTSTTVDDNLNKILYNLINNSDYDEFLKQSLRTRVTPIVVPIVNNVIIETDSDDSESESDYNSEEENVIFQAQPRIIRPPAAYNIFIRTWMIYYKLSKPDLRNTELMTLAALLWNNYQEFLIKMKSVFEELKQKYLEKDISKITSFIIQYKTTQDIKW